MAVKFLPYEETQENEVFCVRRGEKAHFLIRNREYVRTVWTDICDDSKRIVIVNGVAYRFEWYGESSQPDGYRIGKVFYQDLPWWDL